MNTNTEALKKILSGHGIKPTFQRLKILEHVKKSKDHPTVDMMYQNLVRTIPTLSKTTLYSTLKSFMDKAIVAGVVITGSEMRFDYKGCSHHHFLCERCGAIIDLDVICPNLYKKDIGGHVIKEIHGYFKGTCAPCVTKHSKG